MKIKYPEDATPLELDELAIRFHHRLGWIHAFPNGNGRHARLATDLFLKQQGSPRFSWGMHQDLYNPTPTHKYYIAALLETDRGDFTLGCLIKFHLNAFFNSQIDFF